MKNRIVLIVLILSLFFDGIQAQNNASISSRVVGKGKAIILISGLTCDGSVWDETVKILSDNYECHILTLPGFAGKEPIKDLKNKIYLNQMRDDIINYINNENIQNPIFIGHSLGGFIALKIAIEKPKLPSKLIIVDALPYLAAIRNPTITKESVKTYAENYKKTMIEKSKLSYEKKSFTQKEFLKWMISDSTKIETAVKWYLDSDGETLAQTMYEMNTTDLREDISKIEVPTLVLGSWIAGKQYGATKEGALKSYKVQYANLKNVTIEMSDTGKHFIMWDDLDFLIRMLKKFVLN